MNVRDVSLISGYRVLFVEKVRESASERRRRATGGSNRSRRELVSSDSSIFHTLDQGSRPSVTAGLVSKKACNGSIVALVHSKPRVKQAEVLIGGGRERESSVRSRT